MRGQPGMARMDEAIGSCVTSLWGWGEPLPAVGFPPYATWLLCGVPAPPTDASSLSFPHPAPKQTPCPLLTERPLQVAVCAARLRSRHGCSHGPTRDCPLNRVGNCIPEHPAQP